MKRSTVNEILKDGDAFIRSFGNIMPPFAYWTPAELKTRVAEDSPMIRDHALGWDITDYGQGKYDDMGLFLFGSQHHQTVLCVVPGELCRGYRFHEERSDDRGGFARKWV